AAAGVALVEADVGDLGAGVGAPGNGQRAGLGPAEEQRVLDHQPRLGVGDVGELELRGHVAAGEDARVAGAQPVVDLDSLRRVADAGGPETEPLDVRLAAGGDENL